jgi:hypothetical protein
MNPVRACICMRDTIPVQHHAETQLSGIRPMRGFRPRG